MQKKLLLTAFNALGHTQYFDKGFLFCMYTKHKLSYSHKNTTSLSFFMALLRFDLGHPHPH